MGGCKTGTTTAAGDSTSVIDTTNFTDSDLNANYYDHHYLIMTSGDRSGQVRRVSSYSGSAGDFTLSDALTGAPGSSATFEIHAYDPAELNNAINRVLPRLYYWTYFYPSLAADGDMETSGVTNWTGSSSTPTKSSTVAKYGAQGLVSTNSGGNGYIRTASMSVTVGDNYYCEVAVRPDNFEVSLVAYDVTNGTAIKTITHTGREWIRLWANFNVPSGCSQIQIRLQATSASAITYWDNLILQHIDERRLALPSWVTEGEQVISVERRFFDRNLTSGVSYLDEERWYKLVPQPGTEEDRTAVSPFYMQLPNAVGDRAMRFLCVRPYDTLTTDSATTTANKEWVVAGAVMELLRTKRMQGPGSQVGDITSQINAYRKDFERLCRLYQPRIARPMRSPWDG